MRLRRFRNATQAICRLGKELGGCVGWKNYQP
jgi:hypothetical protein